MAVSLFHLSTDFLQQPNYHTCDFLKNLYLKYMKTNFRFFLPKYSRNDIENRRKQTRRLHACLPLLVFPMHEDFLLKCMK